MTDYRKQAHDWAGPGREAMVDAIAKFLHFNESMHMHEDIEAECCAYCWLRAGKAIRALVHSGLTIDSRADEFMALRIPHPEIHPVYADELECLKCNARVARAGEFEPTLAALLALGQGHECLPRVEGGGDDA